jgi:hypothetical protein
MENNNIIICSGGFVNESLRLYFGKIPPSLLPIRNKILLNYQLQLIESKFKTIIINLPISFENDERLASLKSDDNLLFFFSDENEDLKESLGKIALEFNLSSASLLMGDTLFNEELPNDLSKFSVSVANSEIDYSWTFTNDNLVMTGFFYIPDLIFFLTKIEDASTFKSLLIKYSEIIEPEKIKLDSWIDLGHFHTYITNKFNYTTERVFNTLKNSTSDFIEKSSVKINKIIGEYLWFESVPSEIKGIIPKVIALENNGITASYKIEKVYLPTISEIYVFGKLSQNRFSAIVNKCEEVLNYFKLQSLNDLKTEDFYNDIIQKTSRRLNDSNLDLNKIYEYEDLKLSISDIVSSINFDDVDNKFPMSFYHGDFCFSNMFFDLHTNQIKLIDPRGLNFSNSISQVGNVIYDYAKMYHSIVGLYDYIITDQYEVSISNKGLIKFKIYNSANSNFVDYIRHRWKVLDSTLLKINIHLFLSMIPLHSESPKRQEAFIANSIRLFKSYNTNT